MNAIPPSIQITVESEYVAEHSSIDDEQYAFVYTITITNQGTSALQLIARHWHITDGNGKTRDIEGEGVVGEQPQLKPKAPFSYTSSVVLTTPVGVMQGNYTLKTPSDELLKAEIPAFRLAKPNSLH